MGHNFALEISELTAPKHSTIHQTVLNPITRDNFRRLVKFFS